MSASANVELVRSIYAAWERGDFSSAEWADPEIEFVTVGGVDAGGWKGVAEMTTSVRDPQASGKTFTRVPSSFRALDDERFLSLHSFSGRAKSSGIPVGGRLPSKGAILFHVRGGRVTRLVIYWDRDRALADLGLEG